MKRFLSISFALTFLYLTATANASAFDLKNFEASAVEFRNGAISPEEFSGMCEEILATPSTLKPAEKVIVYSRLWEAKVSMGDVNTVIELTDRIIADMKDSPLGYMLKSDTYAMIMRHDLAVDSLNAALEHVTGERDRKLLEDRITNMPYRINNFNPFWSDWNESPKEMEEAYDGASVTISGVITKIGKDGAGVPYILLGVDPMDDSAGIMCSFSQEVDHDSAIDELAVNQEISITGICMGLVRTQVILSNCKMGE